MASIDFSLYLVTDRRLFPAGDALFTAVEDGLKGGVRAVQLREKDLTVREILDMAYRMRELTAKYHAGLFINDRVDIALSAGADGLHLAQSGIPVHAARKITGDTFAIGASAHNLNEALVAEREGADFITFGPVYPTPSKLRYGAPVGTEALKKASEALSIPVFGIGGIEVENVEEVIRAGARGIAVIRGILNRADRKGAAEEYLSALETP
ncbi:MAG: thiamine phosphate synthase [Nitrospirae bacterium]|nr:thiamine phosphate synthase [Nitrospirota bacterium]